MSDFFSGLFGGGGDSSGGGGGGGFFGNLFGGGGDGSSPFDLSSIMGGDSGGGLASLFGGNNGMGSYDPATQTPTPAQTQQGGDPGGQLAGSRPDQGQPGQQGQGQQKRDPFSDFGRILADALKGNFQQPGYSNLSGVAAQAPQVPGQPGQPPGAVSPGAPTSSTASAGPPAPGQPGQQGPTDAQGIPRGPTASAPQGVTPGARTPTSLDKFVEPEQPTPAADQPKVPDKVLSGGQPAAPAAPTGGAQPTGGQGQNQFGQFMKSPLGMIVQMLIGQALGRMGPQGAMIAQMLSPALAQLAGQGGFGTGMRGPFPDYGGRMPANLPPNAGGAPGGAGPGSPHTSAIPASLGAPVQGANDQENRILGDIERRESSGQNLRPDQNYDYPHSHASGYYQYQPRTWQDATQRSGIGTQYREAYLAPKEVQSQVALWTLRHDGTRPWDASAAHSRLPQGYAQSYRPGGTQVAQGGLPPRLQPMPSPFDLRDRRRRRMSMGWQF